MSEEKEKDVPTEVKKTIVGPPRGGIMKRTLEELELLKIKFKNIYEFKDVSINLEWDQIIRLTNYNAEREVLRWDNTLKEALEIIKIFLF